MDDTGPINCRSSFNDRPQDEDEAAQRSADETTQNIAAVVTRPHSTNGVMAREIGAPEEGQLIKAWTREVIERKAVAKERWEQTVGSWTAQNEVRGVLVRMTAGAA